MRKLRRFFTSLLMVCLFMCQGLSVFAMGVDHSGGTALKKLVELVSESSNTYYGWTYEGRTYKCSNGGYKIYSELTSHDEREPINSNALNTLTTGAKSDFLTDYYNAGQLVLNTEEKAGYPNAITAEVGTNWLEAVQNTSGVGSQLMTTLMSQTKPDYVTANRIYAPFSGTVGTILGIVAILIMAFLAITMVLDLAYIALPAFQLIIDGDGQGGQGGGKKKSFISQEAINAVQMAENTQGGGGQSGGSNKLAVSIYFKKRVLMLCVLGICLLYLVSGNIFSLVGWFIDLLSGFLGF